MKISYNWLNKEYFDGQLPALPAIEHALTFHAWEVEEIVEKNEDTLIDVKVLPDKSPWALSHRGIAKDLSAVLGVPLTEDPLSTPPVLLPRTDELAIHIDTPMCDTYEAALIRGVKVGESPAWLVSYLATIGQRSINNIVDATNYVMFNIGQPLHAFDAQKLKGNSIRVRNAKEGETITSLTGETYTLTTSDALIVDGVSDTPLGIAGVKGGKVAEVDAGTTDIIIESAHFDRVTVRLTSQRLKLRTDASIRFENGIVSQLTSFALRDVVALILEIAGGTLVGFGGVAGASVMPSPVLLSRARLNSVLGVSLTKEAVSAIIARFGYTYIWNEDMISVTPPFERTDLCIPEDLIEEIGRVSGYDHVASVTPTPIPLTEINATFYYTECVRAALQSASFSEVFTSSFHATDVVKLKNALASDKGYLRSTLAQNMDEVLSRNAPHADLLRVREIRAFEVGTVFGKEGAELTQALSIALGVRSPSGYKAKHDDPLLETGMQCVEEALGTKLTWTRSSGIAEARLDTVFKTLRKPEAYAPLIKTPDTTYVPFSLYPCISRDIALWCDESVTSDTVHTLLTEHGGELLLHATCFDAFKKEGKVSYAFRLVFQSKERTLTDEEVGKVMEQITTVLTQAGYSVR